MPIETHSNPTTQKNIQDNADLKNVNNRSGKACNELKPAAEIIQTSRVNLDFECDMFTCMHFLKQCNIYSMKTKIELIIRASGLFV